jgi:hypothetical protein
MMKTWEEAFVAVTLALDGTLEDATSALGEAGTRRASDLMRGLRGETTSTRAYALATVLAEVASDLARLELKWES